MRFLNTANIRTRFNERILADDGVELSVDLYLPPEPGFYPILLHRTAADNNRNGRYGISEAPAERWKKLAAQGFILATADVRGRGDSAGQFTPFHQEASDGAATIAWLRSLAEGNGKIGLFGSGYSAFCAWATACVDKNIQAIVSSSPFGAVGEGLVHNQGCVRLDWLFCLHLIGGRSLQPVHVPDWKSIYQHLPLHTMDQALGRSDTVWQEWLNHLDPGDPYWAPLDLAESIAALNIPALHISGWWDGQLNAARYYYQAACQSSAEQQLIIGPWDTAAVRRPNQKVGGIDFGPRSVLDMDEELATYFTRYLVDAGDKNTSLSNVSEARQEPLSSRLFVTGRNEWIHYQGWPETNAEQTLEYCLDSTFGANTCRGDGQLNPKVNPAKPNHKNNKEERVDRISHNPDVPVVFQAGFVSFAAKANVPALSLEQAPITSRDEALVYTSQTLQQSITLCGAIQVNLSLKVDAADADIYVLLSDHFPGGNRDMHLGHAALRLSSLNNFESNKWIKLSVKLTEFVHDLLPGHQLRLTLTPSLFPLYAKNLHLDNYVRADAPVIALIDCCLSDASVTLSLLD